MKKEKFYSYLQGYICTLTRNVKLNFKVADSPFVYITSSLYEAAKMVRSALKVLSSEMDPA
jgi:hypothetical protein